MGTNHLFVKLFMVVAINMLWLGCSTAQQYSSARIFAHNDYVRAQPFYTAYDLQVGYIEADIFLEGSQLLVAHHKHEIDTGKSLESLYLQPLRNKIKANNGFVYANHKAPLTLMIDLKTEGRETLKALATKLGKYPELVSSPTLQIMISGNVPPPDEWNQYPSFIYFDGRPGIPYTADQLKRISMISTSFPSHVKWDGTTRIPEADQKKIAALIDAAHAHGKKFRFWATPDFENAWKELMRLQMDVIVTDKVEALSTFLTQKE